MKAENQTATALWYVTGGKGGVGKSTLARALACELAKNDLKVSTITRKATKEIIIINKELKILIPFLFSEILSFDLKFSL